MQPTDDSALLRQYAENHCDEAFAALVARHINLVYSVAMRCVGDPHQVEEVAQAVFILLAKKAAQLRHDKALSSWLFQTTRLTASNFIRGETRRHRREQEAHMQSVLNEPGIDVWPRIAPLLDDAVAGLNEKDRHAIVLRFYEGRNLREVGAALGASEDAAEKRVNRAVEKLRTFFAKRGVTVGASGLTVVISANAVQAAPVGLALTVSTAAALAGTTIATTATTTAIVMTTLQKTLISVTIAAALGTGIYEARQASGLRRQVQTLQQQHEEQIHQLQRERDVASQRFASLQQENERLNRDMIALLRRDMKSGADRQPTNMLAKLSDERPEQKPQPSEDNPESDQQRQMKQISAAKKRDAGAFAAGLQIFAEDNQGRFPTNYSQVAYSFSTNFNQFNADSNQFVIVFDQPSKGRRIPYPITGTNSFEMIEQGSRVELTNPKSVIMLREQQAWQTPDGKWAKTYAFADGHTEIRVEPDGNFDAWERQHTAPPSPAR
ncbi:MAG: sigma-70 family RNA polymerase sigma factor [Verrucomicrobiales bacterium]|nr:sigma-70 family RNA polymerase sigma factor [Verrucomicrobiales bacterium]